MVSEGKLQKKAGCLINATEGAELHQATGKHQPGTYRHIQELNILLQFASLEKSDNFFHTSSTVIRVMHLTEVSLDMSWVHLKLHP